MTIKYLHNLALGFVLSISLDIFLGLFLGYNENMKNLTGGITAYNVWVYLLAITFILFIIYVYKEYREFNRPFSVFSKRKKSIKNYKY